MKFVNKNAYTQTAIHGYSFCKAAKEAFFLILRNVLRISAVSIVSDFVLIVGKLFIVVASTIGAYLYLDHYYSDYLNGLYMPTVFVFLASFATAEIFNEVFGMAIMTILQCFLTDEEIYPVSKAIWNYIIILSFIYSMKYLFTRFHHFTHIFSLKIDLLRGVLQRL